MVLEVVGVIVVCSFLSMYVAFSRRVLVAFRVRTTPILLLHPSLWLPVERAGVALASTLAIKNLTNVLTTELLVGVVVHTNGVLAVHFVLHGLAPDMRAVALVAVALSGRVKLGA